MQDTHRQVACDVLHAVYERGHDENLPAAGQLKIDRLGDQRVVDLPLRDDHGLATPRRRINTAHFLESVQCGLQGPGNGRGAECEHVDSAGRSLDKLLLVDAEPLLLVDNQQA